MAQHLKPFPHSSSNVSSCFVQGLPWHLSRQSLVVLHMSVLGTGDGSNCSQPFFARESQESEVQAEKEIKIKGNLIY